MSSADGPCGSSDAARLHWWNTRNWSGRSAPTAVCNTPRLWNKTRSFSRLQSDMSKREHTTSLWGTSFKSLALTSHAGRRAVSYINKRRKNRVEVRKLTEGEIPGLCILYSRSRTSFRSEITAPSGYKAPSRFASLGSESIRISFAPQGCTSKCRLPVTGFFQTFIIKYIYIIHILINKMTTLI